MTHDFQSDAHAPHAPLSAAAEARKRELLPVLQRQLGRRRARREAVRGGLVMGAAAVIVGAGAMLSLRAQPEPAPAPDRLAATHDHGGGARDEGASGVQARRSEVGANQRPGDATPSTGVTFRLVRNDPAALDRARIDDRRLVQELRSAGYEAGLVRTRDRVMLMMEGQ